MNDVSWENVRTVLEEWISRVAESYKDRVPSASGDLAQSISGEVNVNGDSYLAVLNLSEAWKYIEYGRKPGKFPPVDAIKGWIQVKNIIPKPFTLPNGKQVIPTENQLAFLIGRKIAKDGIPAKPYLADTVNELREELFVKLSEALTKDIFYELDIAFKE